MKKEITREMVERYLIKRIKKSQFNRLFIYEIESWIDSITNRERILELLKKDLSDLCASLMQVKYDGFQIVKI